MKIPFRYQGIIIFIGHFKFKFPFRGQGYDL